MILQAHWRTGFSRHYCPLSSLRNGCSYDNRGVKSWASKSHCNKCKLYKTKALAPSSALSPFSARNNYQVFHLCSALEKKGPEFMTYRGRPPGKPPPLQNVSRACQRWASTLANRSNAQHRSNIRPPPPPQMYPKCGNLCGHRGRKRFIASWGLRMSHICPCTPCPSPPG